MNASAIDAAVPAYYRYWGKARSNSEYGSRYHLLPYHSLDVAACGWVLLSDDYLWAKVLAGNLGISTEQLRRLFVFFLCLHDIGKFARAFQGQVTDLSTDLVPAISGIPYVERHDSLGFWLWWKSDAFQRVLADALGVSQQEVKKISQLNIWFEMTTGHHGQPPKKVCPPLPAHFDRSDIDAVCSFLTEIMAWWLHSEDLALFQDKALTKRLKLFSWKLAGLAVLADWLGSNQQYFPYRSEPHALRSYWQEHALPGAAAAVEQANLKPHKAEPFRSIHQLFQFIQQPTPLQHYAINQPLVDEPQLFILEDVTGSGKTEAAMVLVHRLMSMGLAHGLYVGLPTMATANAMYARLANCYRKLFQGQDKASLVLAHGARHLSEDFLHTVALTPQPDDASYASDELSASAYCNAWLADNRKKALLADIGVGTIDQALLGVLPARHQSLRLLGLDKKVLLVDEVHAYDPYMKRLLEGLLEMHASQGGNAILLSATLPRKMKQDLVAAYAKGRELDLPILQSSDYPLATQFPGSNENSECPVATRKEVARTVGVQRLADIDAVVGSIRSAVLQGQCVCWIRNTVDDTRQAYDLLNEQLCGLTERVHLFHSRFAMADRHQIESDTLGWFGKNSDHLMRKGRVLVSSQVVEQSLDLDFDVLVSDLAPIDLLLQRAGRLQRHVRDAQGNRLPAGEQEQRAPAILYVLSPDPTDNADADWLSTQKGTEVVYQDLGYLWRSARVLFERGMFRMPEDARYLIEAVYSSDTELATPEVVEQASYLADGKRRAATSMANLNILNVSKGYSRASNDTGWSEEVNVPTRLSDKTVSVVLVIPSDTGGWEPYAAHPSFGWDFSTLKIRENLWREAEVALPAHLKQQMEVLREENNALKWHSLFPLVNEFAHWYHPQRGWLGSKGEVV